MVRRRAITLLGRQRSTAARAALEQALRDSDPFVRRHACEGWVQQPRQAIPITRLIPLLNDPDRFIRFAARVAIEHAEIEKHRDEILGIKEPRALVEAMLALVRATPLEQKQQAEMLEREAELLESKVEPGLKTDVLRLIGLTILLGPRKADAAASARLRPIALALFSTTTDSPLNREVARLLAYLGEPGAVPLLMQHLSSVTDLKAQLHDAYCLRAIKSGWTSETKERLWSWYEKSSRWEAGYSFQGYLDLMIQELLALLDPKEKEQYLARAAEFPFPSGVLVRSLDLGANPGAIATLKSLYVKLGAAHRSGAVADLRALIIEKFGNSRTPAAGAALRELYSNGPPLARRDTSGENTYSLPQLVDNVLQSNVMKSASAARGRQIIERAKCLDCHKFGAVGQGLGPELTTVRSRFRPIEILESIVEPSKVISDQYKAATVATVDGKVYNGMPVAGDGPTLVLLLSDGTKVTIPKTQIDGKKESTVSVMPQGLINSLSYQEVADLLALFEQAPRVEPPAGAKK